MKMIYTKFFIVSLLLSSFISTAKEQRIVALAPHIVEMLFDIGAGNKIVGTVSHSDYPAAALNIPRIGGYHGIQIEKILELKPDIVIVWQSGNKVSDIEQMEKMGLNIIYSQPHKIEDVAKELRELGKLTGHEIQAESVANDYLQRLKKLRQQHVSIAPMKVFYQLWPEPMRTINKGTLINQLIEVCQGQNVFAENPTAYPQIGIENVIVAQPEVIIFPVQKSNTELPVIDWHKWPEIPAVKHNRFIRINADLTHRFSTRMLDGIEDMCDKLDAFR
ncbi:cobalamin-binding protein [Candidatus Colwellia aromaticivorans]|uniref:cobalamin-binding protein n=1 Tax=Candidatus Colwellia aromaticivorans TaxID=2267621 RepID=UPI001FE57FC5|nr:cobalamin-binding protein [Candidatus Colwellia aromaticivorans]